MKSTYSANNQWLWIKFNFDSQKIKDLFSSKEIQQKQPSRGVLRKRCSENMHKIYRRAFMSKWEFNKLHFGMAAVLYIKFAACIFSEHILLRTPLDGCFWYRLFSSLSSCIAVESICMSWKLNERQKNFIKTFMKFLKNGGRGRDRTSYYILPWTKQIASSP